jgi:hypothetical protein
VVQLGNTLTAEEKDRICREIMENAIRLEKQQRRERIIFQKQERKYYDVHRYDVLGPF